MTLFTTALYFLGSTDSDTSQVDIKKRHMSADSALLTINQEHEEVEVDGLYLYPCQQSCYIRIVLKNILWIHNDS